MVLHAGASAICVVCTHWCASRYDKGDSCCYRGSRAMASPRIALRLFSCFSSSSSNSSKMLWLLWDPPSKQLCSGRSVVCQLLSQSMQFCTHSLAGLDQCMSCTSVRILPNLQAFCHMSNQYVHHSIQVTGLSKTRTTQLCAVCCSYRAQAAWHQARLGRS